jgi:hypothetical protein
MSDLVPSGNDPNAGLNFDIGVSIHEWSTRWAEIEDMKDEDLEGALEEARRLLDEMMTQLQIPREGAIAAETEDIVHGYEAIEDVLRRWASDVPVDGEELSDAFDTARDVFDYLIGGRREDDEAPLP